jgi:hypothetical protein
VPQQNPIGTGRVPLASAYVGRIRRAKPTKAFAIRSAKSSRNISFSAHVSGFPARGATNTRVCGFHQGKPHEVRQRQQARQEIRSTLRRTWGTRPVPTGFCWETDSCRVEFSRRHFRPCGVRAKARYGEVTRTYPTATFSAAFSSLARSRSARCARRRAWRDAE